MFITSLLQSLQKKIHSVLLYNIKTINMQIVNLKEIRTKLPHGAMQEIAKRVNLSRGTITMVFNGTINSPKINEILKATAEYLAEYKAKEKEAKSLLEAALSE